MDLECAGFVVPSVDHCFEFSEEVSIGSLAKEGVVCTMSKDITEYGPLFVAMKEEF